MDGQSWGEFPRIGEAAPTQRQFEAAVFAVIARAMGAAERLDLVVERALKTTRFGVHDSSLPPDLLICASDCLRLFAAAAVEGRSAADLARAAMEVWRKGALAEPSGPIQARPTRIQACIGNVRKALGEALG